MKCPPTVRHLGAEKIDSSKLNELKHVYYDRLTRKVVQYTYIYQTSCLHVLPITHLPS